MPPLRILFFLLAANFDRVFAGFLEELLERGHEVRVVVEKQKLKLPPGGRRLPGHARGAVPVVLVRARAAAERRAG